MNIKSPGQDIAFETQAVRVFRVLEVEILSGVLKPGQRLVRRDLTKRFAVSQATVSEALWRLESDGLAESAPMYGTRVASLTVQRVQDELILREALECEVARLVAGNPERHKQEMHGLYALADKVDDLMHDSEVYSQEGMEAHQEFHLSLARLTESTLLYREVERIWRRHCMFFNWVSSKVLQVPAHWHRSLLDAIFSGDVDKADQTMRKHVRYGSERQVEVIRKMQHELTEV